MSFILSNKKANATQLIVFMAMLVSAIVVLTIFMHNLFGLRNTSMTLADNTKDSGDIFAEIVQIYAQDGTQIGLDDMYVKLKLSSLAKPMRLEELGIMLAFDNLTANYYVRKDGSADEIYNCTWDQNSTISGYYINSSGEGQFGLEYSVRGKDNTEGYLQGGDVVKICLRLPQSAHSDDKITFVMIPKKSAPIIRDLHIPVVYSNKNVYVYPSNAAG